MINCSERKGYNFGPVEIKVLEFVVAIADPNGGLLESLKSNNIIVGAQVRN